MKTWYEPIFQQPTHVRYHGNGVGFSHGIELLTEEQAEQVAEYMKSEFIKLWKKSERASRKKK